MKQIQMYEWLIKYDERFKGCKTFNHVSSDVIGLCLECIFCIYKDEESCINNDCDCYYGITEYLEQLVDDIASEEIEGVKSDKVKVVKGLMEEVYIRWFTCLNCKEDYIKSDFKYCPHCGKEIDWEGSEQYE